MDPPTSRPLSAAATASEARPHRPRWRFPAVRSLRVRLTLYLTGMLALTAGLLLLFVNAAAHLARPPITDLPVLVNGEVYNAQVVNAAQVQEQEEALSRLRIFSLVGFVGIVVGGAAIGSLVAGRALQPVTEIAQAVEDHGADGHRLAPLLELGDQRLHRFGLLRGVIVQVGRTQLGVGEVAEIRVGIGADLPEEAPGGRPDVGRTAHERRAGTRRQPGRQPVASGFPG